MKRPRHAIRGPARDATLDQLALSASDFSELIPRVERTLAPIFGDVRVRILIQDDDERSAPHVVRGSFAATDDGLAPTCMISAPLVVRGQPTGVLQVARAAQAFSEADIARCHELAPRIAIAVASTRTLMRLSLQRQIEAILSAEALAIASGTESKAALHRRLGELRVLFEASVIALVVTECDPVVTKAPGIPAAVEQLVLEQARLARHERVGVRRGEDGEQPDHTTLFVPVRLGTEQVGMLATFRERARPFTAAERGGLLRMADLIALSWAWGRYQQHRTAVARLKERQRIADDLHDDVAQILFAAQMHLDSILEQSPIAEETRTRAALARGLLIRGDTAIRNVITKISQPLATGLPERLHEAVEDIDEQFMLPVHLEISAAAAELSGRARRAAVDAIVQVTREALGIAATHDRPCHARVTLDVPATDRLRLRVSDTAAGQSSDLQRLASLRPSVRRAGAALRVTRATCGGTAVTVNVVV